MVQVPQRVESLVKAGQLYAAVQAHLQAVSMLDREGIAQVRVVLLSCAYQAVACCCNLQAVVLGSLTQ